MDCTLCKKPIKDYNPAFHHLLVDDTYSADICERCMDKIMKWQGERIAKLFPTSAMKKRFGNSR